MLYSVLIFIHVMVCLGLIGIVLIQAGRGGGLSQSFSGAESMFGTKTNALLTRATTVFAIIFFITCLSLAFVAKQRSKSLIEGRKIPSVPQNSTTKPQEDTPKAKPEQNTQPSQTQPESAAPQTTSSQPPQPQETAPK